MILLWVFGCIGAMYTAIGIYKAITYTYYGYRLYKIQLEKRIELKKIDDEIEKELKNAITNNRG